MTGFVPLQAPPEHTSVRVQAFPSSQGAMLLVKTQPVAGLQVSSVQALPSLQTTGAPARHAPPPQTSPVVQALPSLQGEVLSTWTQPVDATQESLVQGFP